MITKPAQWLLELPRDCGQSWDRLADLLIWNVTFGKSKGCLWCEEQALSLWQPAGILLEQCRAWEIYTSLLSLYSPQSSGLGSNKNPPVTSSRVQMQPAADSSHWGFVWSTYTKAEILPLLLTCPEGTLHVSWSSVDDGWENIPERAEGLGGAILLNSKGQQQELCWNFTPNLHHSQEGWTTTVRYSVFKGETNFQRLCWESWNAQRSRNCQEAVAFWYMKSVEGKGKKRKGQSVFQVWGI